MSLNVLLKIPQKSVSIGVWLGEELVRWGNSVSPKKTLPVYCLEDISQASGLRAE